MILALFFIAACSTTAPSDDMSQHADGHAGHEDHPGQAVPMQEPSNMSQHSEHADSEADKDHSFVCPMHPEVTSAEAGACPKCGMNLVDVESAEPSPHAHAH